MTYNAEQMRMRFLGAVKPDNYCLREHLSTWNDGADGRTFDVDWVCNGECLEASFWQDSGDSVVFCLGKADRDEKPRHLISWGGDAGQEPPAEVIDAARAWLEKWSAVVDSLA